LDPLRALRLGSGILLRQASRRLREITRRGVGRGSGLVQEMRYRTVIEQSPMAMHVFAPDGTSLLANGAWNELWNLGEGETPEGTNVFVDEQLRAAGLVTYVEDSINGLRPITTPPLFYDPTRSGRKGRARWLQASVYPAQDEGGRLLETTLVIEDVTERKEAEQKLWESEERLRILTEAAFEGIAINENGKILDANRAYADMFGYEVPEVRGMPVLELHPPQTRDKVWQKISSGYDEPYETKGLRKDGTTFDVEIRGKTILYEDRFVRVTAIRDITERKRAEEKLKESEERYRAVMEQSTESIWLFDPNTKQVLEPNTSFQRLLGYTAEELRNMTNYDFVAHSDEDIDETVRQKVRKEDSSPRERKYRRKDGTLLDVEVNGTLISYQGKEVVCSVARDLTERKETEARLRESEERFRSAFEDAPVGAAIVDLDRRYLQVNRALCEMLGYSEEELVGKTSPEVTHPEDLKASADRARRVLEEGDGNYVLEKRYVHADGHVVWALSGISLVRDAHGNPDHFVSLFQDVTERKALEERLEHQAFHDSLTSLANRGLFMDRLEHALARLDRGREPIAVLFMDLDNFKVVNDSLGHEVGDKLLGEVAGRLKECVRPEDTAARFGGDEFVILLEGIADLGGATRVADRITDALTAPFDFEGREIFISTSIGIVLADEAPDEPGDLLRKADLALYRAKEKGRDRYEVFDVSMGTMALERLEMESALRRALERGEFRIYYQPKISVSDGRIVSLEALIRWEHPERGLLEPGEFLPVAEETGLIVQIGEWVLDEVCRQGWEWQQRFSEPSPPRVCANVSPRQFLQTDFIDKVIETLRSSGLRAQGLSLEIAEGILMDEPESNIEKLTMLNDLGIHIVIDDFGTAYSSLAHLKNFPLNILKIDRSLTVKLGEEPEDEAIVSAMINLAQALGWVVTAQGVENEEQLALLRKMGCDIVQGYYFTRPVTSEEATALLEADFERQANVEA